MANSDTKTVAVKTVGTWASSLRVTEYEFFAVTARALNNGTLATIQNCQNCFALQAERNQE